MPESLLLVAKAFFAAAGCGAGVRLAQIARREGGIPLHAWASAMVLVGGIGLLGFGLGPLLGQRSPELARDVMLVTDGLGRLVVMALCVFLWRVFGGGRGARTALLAGLLALLTANWVRAWLAQSWPEPMPVGQRFENQIVLALPFVWSALEARLSFSRSRRQLALGLTDAATTHRFLLWSLACAGFAGAGFASAAASVSPRESTTFAALTLVQAAFHLATAAIVAIAFFPPDAYTRWVSGAPAR
jgi:hypothetical protein